MLLDLRKELVPVTLQCNIIQFNIIQSLMCVGIEPVTSPETSLTHTPYVITQWGYGDGNNAI